MKFTELKVKGAYLIEFEEHSDERGIFAKQFCKKEFESISFDIKQCNISKNYKKGTLRGLHYQKAPYEEVKLVSCFKGKCFDVIVDLRPNSPTYLKWDGAELTENKSMYIPALCAHGFQTLEDDTILYYQLGEYFMPEHYAGIRWNDPKIGIKWHETENLIMNERDKNYELL
jgi:dTDP-4-dehydrorhamnose 3,5-epimerase